MTPQAVPSPSPSTVATTSTTTDGVAAGVVRRGSSASGSDRGAGRGGGGRIGGFEDGVRRCFEASGLAVRAFGSGEMEPLLFEAFDAFRGVMGIFDPESVRFQLNELQANVQNSGLQGDRALEAIHQAQKRNHLQNLNSHDFTLFYRFVFFICRDVGKRTLQVGRAIDAWRSILKSKFRLLEKWCEFVKSSVRLVITEDTWRQVLDFSRQVHEDLSNYDPSSAWPVLLDEFVEHLQNQRTSSRNRLYTMGTMDPGIFLAPEISAPRMVALSPSAGSKRRPPDVEAVAAQLSNLPMLSSPMDIEGQEVVKKICVQIGDNQKGVPSILRPFPSGSFRQSTPEIEADDLATGLKAVGIFDRKTPPSTNLELDPTYTHVWVNRECCLDMEDREYDDSGLSDDDGEAVFVQNNDDSIDDEDAIFGVRSWEAGFSDSMRIAQFDVGSGMEYSGLVDIDLWTVG